jgi:hypothetical protein
MCDLTKEQNVSMADGKGKVGASLRFLASDGWADQDPDVVRELLTLARELATQVVDDENASAETRSRAQTLLERLASDALE